MFFRTTATLVLALLISAAVALEAAAQPAPQDFADLFGNGGGKDVRIATIVKQLQETKGEPEKIAPIANKIHTEKIDVAQVIGRYAATNFVHASRKQDRWLLTKDWNGKELPDGNVRSAKAIKEFIAVLDAGSSNESAFHRKVVQYIESANAAPDVTIARLLEGTVKNYSVEAIANRGPQGAKRWPFPFCIPNCED